MNDAGIRPPSGRTVQELVALASGLGAQRLVTFAALPIVIHTSGSAATGRLLVIEAVTQYLPLTLGQGHVVYAQRHVITRDSGGLAATWSALAFRATFAFVAAAALTATVRPDDSDLWFAGLLAALLQCLNPAWVLRGTGALRAFSRVSATSAVVSIVSVLLGVAFIGREWYFLGIALGNAVAVFMCLRARKLQLVRANWPAVRLLTPFALASISVQLYSSGSLFCVTFTLGLKAAAIYGTMLKLQSLALAAYSVLGQFVLPRLGGGDIERRRLVRQLRLCAVLPLALVTIPLLGLSVFASLSRDPRVAIGIALLAQVCLATAFLVSTLSVVTGSGRFFLGVTFAGALAGLLATVALGPWVGLGYVGLGPLVGEFVVVGASALRYSVRTNPTAAERWILVATSVVTVAAFAQAAGATSCC